MPKEYARRIGSLLLSSAVWIAPQETFEWGQAMLSEVSYVEGEWAALIWAIGGARVLAKHALLSMFIQGRRKWNVPFSEEFFAKEVPMRKTTLAAVGACAVASLLFFLAPAFRQAFQVSLAPWYTVIHVKPWSQQPNLELKVLTRRAEYNHDAEGLAFVAVRHWDAGESARLAQDAVHLNPELIWVYAVVAVGHPELSQIDQWVSKLEQWDPHNAVPHLLTAESIDIRQVIRGEVLQRTDLESRAWQDAMSAAFHSPRLDNYYDRLKELDRRVLKRYSLRDPYQAIGCSYCLPSFTASDSSRYAQSILESGEFLEAHGDRKGAFEKYWTVVHFGQMIGSAGGFMVNRELQKAYTRIGALSEKEGKHQQAQLCAYLSSKVDQEKEKELNSLRSRFNGDDVARSNALLVRTSALSMLFFAGLLVISGLAYVVRVWSHRLNALRANTPSVAFGFGGAIGLLLSSVLLYVSYRPYDEILQRYIHTGDDDRIPELSEFLAHMQIPLGAENFKQLPDFVFYFWAWAIVLCMVALLLAVVLYLRSRPRTSATT